MPTPPSEEPLAPTSVKLFAKDVEFLKRRYGQGWTSKVRSIVREHLRLLSRLTEAGEKTDAR